MLTAKQRKLLAQLVSDIDGDAETALPEVAAWRRKLSAED
jgi:hypothetical protein